MQRHYEELPGSIVAEPDARLSALNMLTTAEQAQQLTKERELAKSVYKKFMSANLKPVSLPKTAPQGLLSSRSPLRIRLRRVVQTDSAGL